MTAAWLIAQPHAVSRAKVNGEGRTIREWVVPAGAAAYPTRRAACLAFVRAMDPALTHAPDDYAMRHWSVYSRNGEARAVRGSA